MNELKDYMLANKDALVTDAKSGSFPSIDKEALIILARLVTKARVKYNVAFSKEAIGQLMTSCSEAKEMREFARQTEDLLLDNFNILSGKVRYKGFPNSVMNTDSNLLLADSVLYYMGLTDEPLFTDNSRVIPCPGVVDLSIKPIKTIKHVYNGTEYVAGKVISELLDSEIALSSDNQSLLAELSYYYHKAYTPDYSTVKFQTSLATSIAGRIAGRDRNLDHVCLTNINNILRIAIGITSIKAENFQDDLKIRPVRFDLSTSEKKQLLRLFEQATGDISNMVQYAETWKAFYTNLSLSLNKYPRFKEAMKQLYNKELVGGANAYFEQAINDRDTKQVIYLGKRYPTLVARNLLRLHDLGFYITQDTYYNILDKVPMRVLLQVYNRVVNYRNNKLDYRLVSYNGDSYTIKENDGVGDLHPYDSLDKLLERLVTTKVSAKVEQFALNYSETNGDDYYLGNEYAQLAIPTSLKESNTHFKYTTPYSHKYLDIKDTGNIRLYTYWENVELDNPIDVDLSATFYDKDFNKVTDISYYNPSETKLGAVHSGDITDAPVGAVEAIDFNLDMAKSRGIRYVAVMDNVYAGSDSFKKIGTVSFGVANYKDKLALEDPKALKDVYGVNNNSNFSIMAVYDLEENALITIDSNVATPKTWGNNAFNMQDKVKAVAKWYATRNNARVGEFIHPRSVKTKEIPFTNETATKLINYILGDDADE